MCYWLHVRHLGASRGKALVQDRDALIRMASNPKEQEQEQG